MKTRIFLMLLVVLATSCGKSPEKQMTSSLQNRPPLHPKKYMELPLGSILPEGWLLLQMELMRDGMTGHLDEWYPSVVGDRNGWLGGNGDGWERGVYWLDGLVPLAWLLDDQALKDKAMRWIEWTLNSQTETGYFGPVPFNEPPEPEAGLQKTMREDWWPKMVMLKVLQQYYEVSGDERVPELMLNYFRFQLKTLPDTPLDNWTFWANRRGGDNLMAVYWLYNLTGEPFLLELADLLHEQTFPWTSVFLNEDCYEGGSVDHLYPYNTGNTYPFDQELISRLCTRQLQSFHCVNLAQGIKEPVIRYQQDADPRYLQAVEKAFRDVRLYHGQPQGMYGGDEPLHGNVPTQGIELCSVVELMYSLEKMIAISGNPDWMDHLERIAYNALPTQVTDDFSGRQYFQQANQVMLTRHRHNFYEEDHHGSTDLCYGLLTGYPCCTCNLHQGWPKLTSHLWYASGDGGLAAVVYAPCNLTTRVGDGTLSKRGTQDSKGTAGTANAIGTAGATGTEVSIREETNYPFEDRIRFHISTEDPVMFPLHLRIPGWCTDPELQINGEKVTVEPVEGMAVLNRTWKEGDLVELHLPMQVSLNRWVENSVSVERGPLVYVLKIREQWTDVENTDRWGHYKEVRPVDPWNIGLLEQAVLDPESGFEFVTLDQTAPGSQRTAPGSQQTAPGSQQTDPGSQQTDPGSQQTAPGSQQTDPGSQQTGPGIQGDFPYPWTLENAPVALRTRGKIIPDWKLYREMAGPLPHSLPLKHLQEESALEITLIPYGCSTLRITEFPVVR